MHNEDFSILEGRINYTFENKSYLQIALTHSSFSNEMKINVCDNYERQEFLGDAILEFVSSDFLFKEHISLAEGKLTKLRASMVCEPTLAYCARQFGLEEFIRLGKGEEAGGGRNKDSIISDVLEALIGAIYLDSGIENAVEFIKKFILNDVENKLLFYDAKSILQEKIQKIGKKLEYNLIDERGPAHDKIFVVEAIIDGVQVAIGEGHSKKAAQQQAAFEALRNN